MTPLTDAVDLIVFDFDGTICESANVKTDAFYQLYLDEQGPDFAAAVRDYHLEYAGVSRYDKIKHVEEQMLRRPCSDERLEEVADRFGNMVRGAVIAAPLVGGVSKFFESRGGEVPMVVASATPTEELRSIVAARGIEAWFEEVQGSPTSKAQIIGDYLAGRAVDANRAVMVGDQFSDLHAAEATGVPFVAYRPLQEARLFADDVLVVNHFHDLAAAIAAHAADRAAVRRG